MNYAIVEEGIVVNVISLHPMNAQDFPNAVCADDCPVLVGDSCVDGVFYRDGAEVKTNAQAAAEEKADMKAALAELGVIIDG